MIENAALKKIIMHEGAKIHPWLWSVHTCIATEDEAVVCGTNPRDVIRVGRIIGAPATLVGPP